MATTIGLMEIKLRRYRELCRPASCPGGSAPAAGEAPGLACGGLTAADLEACGRLLREAKKALAIGAVDSAWMYVTELEREMLPALSDEELSAQLTSAVEEAREKLGRWRGEAVHRLSVACDLTGEGVHEGPVAGAPPAAGFRRATLAALRESRYHLHSNAHNMYRNIHRCGVQRTLVFRDHGEAGDAEDMKTQREAEDRSDYFRASVGAMLVDKAGRILVLKRTDSAGEGWQMPQGGIRPGENPEAALARELREETGLAPGDLSVLAVCREWLVYELPEAYRNEKVGRGQAQKWFLCRLRGAPEKIAPDGIEFSAYEWVDPAGLLRRAAPFRKPVYGRLLNEFAPHLTTAD